MFNLKINNQYLLFYLLLFSYMCFGIWATHNFILDYERVQKLPKQVFTIYVYYGKYLFLKPIIYSLLLNMIWVYFLLKKFNKTKIIKNIAILFALSILGILLIKSNILNGFHENFFIKTIKFILFFLFASKFFIQSFSILAICLMILFPFVTFIEKSNEQKKFLSVIGFMGYIINFFILGCFFPQYWIGPTANINYF